MTTTTPRHEDSRPCGNSQPRHQLAVTPQRRRHLMDREVVEQLVKQLRSNASNRDLSIRTTTIPDGAMQDKIIIEVNSKSGFRLLDLPCELRERIYGFVFGRDRRIEINTYTVDLGTDSMRHKIICGPFFRNEFVHKGQRWDAATSKWTGGPPNVLSLLSVNRRMHAEATPVAYRSNCFYFKCNKGSRLELFIHTIGPSIQHLGQITLGKVGSIRALKSNLTALRKATGLRRLFLPAQIVLIDARNAAKDAGDPDSWACAFNRVVSNFLIELQKSYRVSGRSWRAVDVMQFSRCTAVRDDEAHRQLDQFEATFREIGMGYLEDV